MATINIIKVKGFGKTDALSTRTIKSYVPALSGYVGIIRNAMRPGFADTVIIDNSNHIIDGMKPADYYREDGTINSDAVVNYYREMGIYKQIHTETATHKFFLNYCLAVVVTPTIMGNDKEARAMAEAALAEIDA